MSLSLRTLFLSSVASIVTVACASTDPAGSAAVVRKLSAAPSDDVAGTWAMKDPSYPGGIKSELELAADGGLTLSDFSTQPMTTSTGSWGVATHQLDLIYDLDDPATYRRTAWTYSAGGACLGIALLAAGSNAGPVGTWSGELIDQQVDSTGTATSGTDVTSALALATDGSATSHIVTATANAGSAVDDEVGTYAVGSDGSIALALHAGSGSETATLDPCAGAYASPVFVHP
jgi:hypothetical protein